MKLTVEISTWSQKDTRTYSQGKRRGASGALGVLMLAVFAPTASGFIARESRCPGYNQRAIDQRRISNSYDMCLFASSGSNNETSIVSSKATASSSTTSSPFFVQDPRVLAGDVAFIALAAQLLGLNDILNDPSFWQQGGWFQPVSMSATQSSLPTLVQRDSILSICWVLSALGCKGYKTDEASINSDVSNSSDGASGELLKLIRISVCFCLLRVGSEFGIAAVVHGVGLNLWDVIRQCYFTLVFVGSFRFIYNQCTR